MSTWSIIPLKSFKRPKSRLNDSLSLDQRRSLVKAMFITVSESLKASSLFKENFVVTEDKEVIKFAKSFGIKGFLQNKPGLNQGVKEITAVAKQKKVKNLFIIHADIPGVDEQIIRLIFNKHRKLLKIFKAGVTIAPDLKGEGSNCMICSPPDIIKFRYGPDSCTSHLEEAYDSGAKVQLYTSKKLGMDLDRDKDLIEFMKKKGLNHISEYFKQKNDG
tara:strand:+ start:746 stop:1399 length:654 start_codon:yes stop_codon:yes gene_type:complete